ncbi:MAG: CoA transferase [Pseudomonadota bacterium]
MTDTQSGKPSGSGPLAGIQVLDLADERGIYGSKLLADLGADVVRLEPLEGDPLRRRGPFAGAESLYFAFMASNRRTVRLTDSSDTDLMQKLLANADIVLVCDGHPGLEQVDAEPAHSGQIWIDISSFGPAGPWADFVAPDLVAGALGGAVATTGDAQTTPLKTFGELNFMVSGIYAAIAALSGLANVRAGGAGQRAHVSVHESIASCLEQVFMFYWYHEVLEREPVLPRRGPTHWSDAFTVMNGQNGSIMITPTPDFDRQLAWLVEEDAHGDLFEEQYQGPENLRALIGRTMQLLAEWVATRDVEELFFAAQERHIPYGWVQPLARLAENPQLNDRAWFVDYAVDGRTVKGPGAPYHFSKSPWRMAAREEDAQVDWHAPTVQAGSAVRSRPLAGLKVLDFSHVLAGPFATRVLGDMGADVIKVNSESRALTSNAPEHPYYIMWNRNKRALALNMADPEGQALCRRLAEQADVVIDNFSVGVLDRWGVGYDTVSAVNEKVIYVQMSGMGDGGSWSNFVTYAPTIHALAGLTSLTGVPGREDVGIGYSYNDHMSGLHGAVAILAALEARYHSGQGQRVDISQFEIGANFAGPSILDFFANDTAATATGNKLPYDVAAPHGVYQCAPLDAPTLEAQRWVAIACMDDVHWQSLKNLLGNPAWAASTELDTAAGRVAHADEIDAQLAAWTAGQEDYAVMAACQAAGVPAGVVQNGIDLNELDPQLARRNFARQIADVHPDIGQTWADILPIDFADTPCEDYTRVRALGEDNAAVLADWLDMDAATTQDLEQRGVLK